MNYYKYLNINYINAVKWLIASKISFFYIKYVFTVYIYYVYINTHTYSIYIENIYMYIYLYSYILYYI